MATTECISTCILNLSCECLLNDFDDGRREPPRIGDLCTCKYPQPVLALTLVLLRKTTPFCCPNRGRSPHWQCPLGLTVAEGLGGFSQLPLTFPSAFELAVLMTDALCQSPPRGHGENLTRCLSQSRYSHWCWHLVTASPWPDLIGLYMSLPKETSGDIRAEKVNLGSPSSCPSLCGRKSVQKGQGTALVEHWKPWAPRPPREEKMGTGSVQMRPRVTEVFPF